MVDDKTKRRAQDRRRVSVSEPYEVNYFARKHGLTKEAALEILKQTRGDREAANRLAEERK